MAPPNILSLQESRIRISEYELPFHIQEEIMKMLPVKSLIQFRSVSKAWKSLIDSSQFIAAHSLLSHTQPHHLFVSYEDLQGKENYVCYIDDDTSPQQRYLPTIPESVKQIEFSEIVGISHGLVCAYGFVPNQTTTLTVAVWNPLIRKSVVVVAPRMIYFGIGVCPATLDPKIVSITQSSDKSNFETSYQSEVMVYTLNSGKWRSLSNNLHTKPIRDSSPAVTNGFICWHGGLPCHEIIISFDLSNESFEMIDLPDSLACHGSGAVHISKLMESLAMLQYKENICTVWMMNRAGSEDSSARDEPGKKGP